MLLKSLELQGFKTFPDKTELSFDPGITSVVGPNGSGKSNISDAIRWVLGEQSTKSLRCSKMEDVVFLGTEKRKSRGFAQVTLNIDNSDRRLEFDSDEVSVTRRYYRSGESEYLINKTTVRLKDIHELFMDTGLGRDGYSIIGQGKIDEIISSKAEDRREIFEEAAGISKYRYRKGEAVRRLSRAEENLLRLRDIVSELEARVGPLKDESKKAEEFLEINAEKKTLEIGLWVNTLEKSNETLKEHENKINIARNQEAEAENKLDHIREEAQDVYAKMNSNTARIDEIRRDINSIEQDLSEVRREAAVFKNDIEHNDRDISNTKQEIESAGMSAKDLDDEIAKKEESITKRKDYIEEKENEVKTLERHLSEAEEDIGRFSQENEKLVNSLSDLSNKASDFKLGVLTSESSIVEVREGISSLDKSEAELRDSVENSDRELLEYREMGQDLESDIKSLSSSINELNLKAENKKRRVQEVKDSVDKLNLDVMEALRKASLLEDLERNLEGFQKSVKTVMREAGRKTLMGIHGPVSRTFKVDSKYATALETALGGAMQNIVVETEDDAKRAISYLKENNGGRATFLPINTIRGRTLNESGLESEPGFVNLASKLCSFDPRYQNIISSLLGRIVVAENIDYAFNIAKKYSYRFKVVTMDGQVVNTGGSLTGGSKIRNSGLLSRANDIERIRKRAGELKTKLDEKKLNLDAAKNELAKLEESVFVASSEMSLKQEDYIKLKAATSSLELKIQEDKKSLIDTKERQNNLNDRLDSLLQRKKESEKHSEALQQEITKLEDELHSTLGNRDNLTSKREEIIKQIQDNKLDMLTAKKEVESVCKEITGIRSRKLDKEERLKLLKRNIEVLEEKNRYCTEQIDITGEKEKRLLQEVQKHNNTILELSEGRNDLEKRSVELRKSEQDKLTEKETIGRDLARLEERKDNLQAGFDDITTKLWDEYELSMREAKEVGAKIENVQTAQKRLNELKTKIKKMGSVNVSAIEEYREVGKRYEFMKEQVDDVEKSKKELISLISDLTHRMKDVFIASFKEINENFSYTFKELFGGGSAQLVLSDPEDILNSGIEIEVQPEGKLLLRLEALSGGEKALVAISLYFAIMKVSPAPFCVLDEIEAALDDVNVDRFAAYLRKMNEKTQFVIITHRRGTMEGSDTLYGVTMQDEGISKLLSLNISKAEDKITV